MRLYGILIKSPFKIHHSTIKYVVLLEMKSLGRWKIYKYWKAKCIPFLCLFLEWEGTEMLGNKINISAKTTDKWTELEEFKYS